MIYGERFSLREGFDPPTSSYSNLANELRVRVFEW